MIYYIYEYKTHIESVVEENEREPVPGGVTGPSSPEGCKCGKLVLQVESEVLKYGHDSRGTRVRK
jgi:hypothetical protein